MTEIYINLPETLTPGQVICGEVSVTGGPNIHCALRCIRPAERREYLEFVESHGLLHMVNRNLDNMNLYLVEVLD